MNDELNRVRLLVQGDDQVRRLQLRRRAHGAGHGEETHRAPVRGHARHRALDLRQGGRRRRGRRARQAPRMEPLQGGDGAGAARLRPLHVQHPEPPPHHGRRRPDARRGRAPDTQGQGRLCPAAAAKSIIQAAAYQVIMWPTIYELRRQDAQGDY
jgi:hypothetical protein